MQKKVIIVPCYNEVKRLIPDSFSKVVIEQPDLTIIFVNDGSTDTTLQLLESMKQAHPEQVDIVNLETNRGKAEAVRQGVIAALKSPCTYIGYWDADLATPLEAIESFSAILTNRTDIDIVIGSRVRLLGRNIKRRAARHYVSRIFATCASWLLDIGVYDTQCGAKLFRRTEVMSQVFALPFKVNWIFDVEILARFIVLSGASPAAVSSKWVEYPLEEWQDVRGSKIKTADFIKCGFEFMLLMLAIRTPARRRYALYLSGN